MGGGQKLDGLYIQFNLNTTGYLHVCSSFASNILFHAGFFVYN